MVRDILTYPDERINIISPDLRVFDEELFSVIQDLKDTIDKYKVNAMSAIQIGIAMSVIVLKEDDGTFLEIINPRIIRKSGLVDSTESTLYFPNVTHDMKRFEKLKLIYQDREGNQHSLSADGKKAKLLQRKIDYVFGGTLANRMKNKGRKAFEKELSAGGIDGSFESCPTVFKRDYIKSFTHKIFFFIIIANIVSFFVEPETVSSLYTFIIYGLISSFLLIVAYLFVGYYEIKVENTCSSCKIGNIVTNTMLYLLEGVVLSIVSFYLLS